jgi:hypothetical protein
MQHSEKFLAVKSTELYHVYNESHASLLLQTDSKEHLMTDKMIAKKFNEAPK